MARRIRTRWTMPLVGVALVVALFAFAGCGGITAVTSTGSSSTAASLSTTTITVGGLPAADPSASNTTVTFQVAHGTYGSETLRVSKLTEIADVILRGRVVGQLPARWNGPDGKQWAGTTEDDIPMLYTTWYVTAEEVLKGNVKVGDKVAFRMAGGLPPDAGKATQQAMTDAMAASDFPSLQSNEEVIIFGFRNDTRFGGTYEPAGYWIVAGSYSVFLPTADGAFERVLKGAYQRDDIITPSQIKALVQ